MHRSLARFMTLLMGTCLFIASADATETAAHQRLSLAISGGASKGAYEAGLNWAVLKIVREAGALKIPSGGQFRPVELASVAGASAGGVNTLLSSLTWCDRPEAEGGIPNRIDKNVFRDIWLQVDINDLLPPRADSASYLPDDAVFSRKEYFAAAAGLRDLWHKPAFRSGCRVPLGVTVTRVEPQALWVDNIEVQNQRFYIPFELRVDKDGSIGYYFDPGDYPELSDPAMILMPRQRDAPEFSISDERVIDTAAASSAFPTAFGRRRIQYCRIYLHSGAATATSDAGSSATDLVCPPGYALDEAEFADGGLFDNLPVGLARTLAERSIAARDDPLPVTYAYIDPDRIRYQAPEAPERSACAADNPPAACRIMEFSFFSESRLLVGALGTARRYELYREITSEEWRFNLSNLGAELANALSDQDAGFDCRGDLPFFDAPVDCPEAIRHAANFLLIAYGRINPAIPPPFSYRLLTEGGIAGDCDQSAQDRDRRRCRIDVKRYRNTIAKAFINIIERSKIADQRLFVAISQSRQSIYDDRRLRVSSRGSPITGTLLGDFGSFLDYKFREYDYYIGIYDAVVNMFDVLCGAEHPREQQPEEFAQCVDALAPTFYEAAGIGSDPRGRYVFARLAESEFAKQRLLRFAYAPLPPVDRDMQIIHDGLAKALEAGEQREGEARNIFVTENTFFAYLKAEHFVPTPAADGKTPLLAEIMADPQSWPTELTRRVTTRLVYLERQATNIYSARDPDPEEREASYTGLMGASAFLLQSATYKYPAFTFSPSTAPDDWLWRSVIPYEVDFDVVEGDILLTWQPTWRMSENNLLDVRASLGFAGGMFKSSSSRNRENYLALGAGYIRRTGSAMISSFGITPTWYHDWTQPESGNQDTGGGDIHVSFLNDRLRVGFGTRDVHNFNEDWFLTFGFTDMPGAIYWLTR